MSLDIRPLRVLDSIMSTGSVTEAAHMMHRTQPQISRILPYRDGVEINHAPDAVMVILKPNPVPDRAKIVPQRGATGWLNA